MITEGLQALIDKGQAELKNFTGTGGQFVIDSPKGKAIVITHIKVNAFADLPLGSDFLALNHPAVHRFFIHVLTVKTKKGVDRFHCRHKKLFYWDGVNQWVIPQGQIDFDTFLKHEDNVIFQLVHAPDARFYNNVSAPLPQQYPNESPPFGYGNAPGGVATVQSMQLIPALWNSKPQGKFAPDQPATPISDTSYNYPTVVAAGIGGTTLNPPLPNLNFNHLTIPVIDIQYVLVNKGTNATY